MALSNAERVRHYKVRQKAKGKRRLDVVISGRAMARLDALRNRFETVSQTMERIILARRPGQKNFRDALHGSISGNKD